MVISKKEMIDEMAPKYGMTKKSLREFIDALLDFTMSALEDGDSIGIPNFGKFEVRVRSERQGRNPRTGETVTVPASKFPAFKPSKSFKEKVKNS